MTGRRTSWISGLCSSTRSTGCDRGRTRSIGTIRGANLIEKRSGPNKAQYFSYDCENRLVRAQAFRGSPLESKGDYGYDSLGRRVAKRAETEGVVGQKRFLWPGLRMLREETAG